MRTLVGVNDRKADDPNVASGMGRSGTAVAWRRPTGRVHGIYVTPESRPGCTQLPRIDLARGKCQNYFLCKAVECLQLLTYQVFGARDQATGAKPVIAMF